MGRSKTRYSLNTADPWTEDWRRQRKEQVNPSAYNLPNVDVHGLLFAVVAILFVVYPLAQWALGR